MQPSTTCPQICLFSCNDDVLIHPENSCLFLTVCLLSRNGKRKERTEVHPVVLWSGPSISSSDRVVNSPGTDEDESLFRRWKITTRNHIPHNQTEIKMEFQKERNFFIIWRCGLGQVGFGHESQMHITELWHSHTGFLRTVVVQEEDGHSISPWP